MISERNYSRIDESDLRVLLNNSKTVLHKYFYSSKGNKWLDLYDINNPICVALCQGAAMHYFDKTNGIKDFDIWFFLPIQSQTSSIQRCFFKLGLSK